MLETSQYRVTVMPPSKPPFEVVEWVDGLVLLSMLSKGCVGWFDNPIITTYADAAVASRLP